MKKCIFCLLAVLCIGVANCYSQNVEQLLKKVSKAENVEKVSVNGLMMSLGKMLGGIGDMPLIKGVDSMDIFTFSVNDTSLKNDFVKLFNNAKDEKGYETLIFVKDKKEGIRILVKKEKDIIKDMIFLCMSEEEPTVIKFSGKIKQSDIDELVEKYNN